MASPFHLSDDPNPDLHEMFLYFNSACFGNALDAVEVGWSPKMTLCAGMCSYFRGGYCKIRLSEPLLKFRSKSDRIDTLLHEMIHAYLFVTENNDDHDGHGPQFMKQANRINDSQLTNITVYHSFHDEVDHYRVHVWKCNGPCQNQPPYFGIVRRAMNRPPQPADRWWADHQMSCGGEYSKISGPEDTNKPARPTSRRKPATGDRMSLVKTSASPYADSQDDPGCGLAPGGKRRKVDDARESDSQSGKASVQATLDDYFKASAK
ncbi:SprT-like family-domain-containing protein [Polychytrium aggregatum]|uniref:SprT-like family-domain-containing protein n=1 Tax=Polychytrium aggregatum TaxID=110093 RepID=UPI0022FEEC6F|nr:SprT-like family-domain-containing protein [Polychytrium aggregatum]KAI9193610.1 SprT-like family-domain-containing protein [Polychytrium aggregatum]